MNDRIVVDPITRIEGHLRIEAQMDGDRIAEAYSSGTMVRGIEIILQAVTRVMPGHLPNVSAVSAPWCMASHRCEPSRMPSITKSRRMPS